MTSFTVLCIDDETEVAAVADAIAPASTLEPTAISDAEAAIDHLETTEVDAVVTEYDLPDGTGLEVIGALRREQPQTPAVLFTDARPNEIDTGAFDELVVEYLSKATPEAHDRLVPLVTDLIEHSAQVGFLQPDDEAERLAKLAEYDVDALPVGDSFERLTDLIASHFDADVAFIGLIDDEEEDFLACHGADWDTLTREDTICTHSMLHEDVMVVEDVAADRRFNANETLMNLGIRAYAGANMTAPTGEVIGQVCLIDHEPRRFDEAERKDLQAFAETAMEVLELRQRVLDAGGVPA